MFGPVAPRVSLRSGRGLAAAAVAGFALMGGGATLHAQAQTQPPPCSVGVLGTCLIGGSGSSSTPAPTVCILLICNPGSPSGGTSSGTTATPTPTPSCMLPACLPVNPNPSCSITSDPTCVLGGSPAPCTSNCGPGSPHPGTPPPGTEPPRGGTPGPHPTGTLFTGLAIGLGGAGGSSGGNAGVPPGLSVATVPVVQQLGPGAGLQFGHAPILWPLFGALDLLGLVAVYFAVRRSRAAHPD